MRKFGGLKHTHYQGVEGFDGSAERPTVGLLLWQGDEQNFGYVQASAAVPA